MTTRRLEGAGALALALALVLLIGCGKREHSGAPPGATMASGATTTEAVRATPVDIFYEATGTIQSKTRSTLSSKIVGSVVAVHVREGDVVESGRLLVEIDDRDANAQLAKAQAGLLEAQNALGEIDQSLRAAGSAHSAAAANSALAAATNKRYKQLVQESVASQQEADETEARMKAASAEATQAEEMVKSVEAKRQQVLSKIEQAKAELTNAQTYATYTKITAPYAGQITMRQVEPGNMASPGVPLLEMEDQQTCQLEAAVDEANINAVRLGAIVRVAIDAVGVGELDGKVTEIVPAANPSSRSFVVKVELPPRTSMRSGMFGRAKILTGKKDVLTVPRTAIVERGQLTSLYVVDTAKTARLRLVKTGTVYGERIEILSGLDPGETIVVSGVETVADGTRVTP